MMVTSFAARTPSTWPGSSPQGHTSAQYEHAKTFDCLVDQASGQLQHQSLPMTEHQETGQYSALGRTPCALLRAGLGDGAQIIRQLSLEKVQRVIAVDGDERQVFQIEHGITRDCGPDVIHRCSPAIDPFLRDGDDVAERSVFRRRLARQPGKDILIRLLEKPLETIELRVVQ
jgi:hypothetical protein